MVSAELMMTCTWLKTLSGIGQDFTDMTLFQYELYKIEALYSVYSIHAC